MPADVIRQKERRVGITTPAEGGWPGKQARAHLAEEGVGRWVGAAARGPSRGHHEGAQASWRAGDRQRVDKAAFPVGKQPAGALPVHQLAPPTGRTGDGRLEAPSGELAAPGLPRGSAVSAGQTGAGLPYPRGLIPVPRKSLLTEPLQAVGLVVGF